MWKRVVPNRSIVWRHTVASREAQRSGTALLMDHCTRRLRQPVISPNNRATGCLLQRLGEAGVNRGLRMHALKASGVANGCHAPGVAATANGQAAEPMRSVPRKQEETPSRLKRLQRPANKLSARKFLLDRRVHLRPVLGLDHLTISVDLLGQARNPIGGFTALHKEFDAAAIVNSVFGLNRFPQG
jgi:hypothetical protein